MANTIEKLYSKYTNKVGRTLENDRYFQYLYEMIESSPNTFLHHHQVLHKVVDERWLSIIEESLDAINTIIEKPRRFVTTTEEVVPVALAKKITADSVRHLSMNTQFIASDENGEIQPTRILNVSTEESFDLYENRFIYHLIQRLVTFIDKRTDVIFWSTGDETSDTMKLESTIDDAYEQISYKLEMTVKNNQSFVENDSDNMSVFMRIDHVRRLVMALRQSSFCSLMAGCAKVHSPIQRTNLMMKDPHYRTCYKLWQFLESYDEVGYTIDVQQTPMEFDEEYMIQMYTNLITNYTVFKSLLETDKRRIDETPVKKRRQIKPKFVKQIQEEFVVDRDIPEVEIRKVFIEEVTQAQLDAEAKVEELTAELERISEAYEKAEDNAQTAMMQVGQLMQNQIETEAALAEEREARTNAEAELEQLTADAEAALAEAEAENTRITEDAEAEKERLLAEAATEKEKLLAEAKAERDRLIASAEAEITRIKAEAEAEKTKLLEAAKTDKDQAVALAVSEKDKEIANITYEKDKAIAETVAEKDKAVAEQKAEVERIKAVATDKINQTKAESDAEIRKTKEAAESEIGRIKIEATSEINRIKSEGVAEISRIKQEADTKISTVNAEREAEVSQLKRDLSFSESTKAEVEFDKLELEKKLAAESEAHTNDNQAATENIKMLTTQVEKKDAEIQKLEKKVQKLKSSRRVFGRRNRVQLEDTSDKE